MHPENTFSWHVSPERISCTLKSAGDEGPAEPESPADHPIRLVIDPEFRALIPRLTEDERQQLAANLEADGCLDTLKFWAPDDGQPAIILDGHTRYEILLGA